MSTKFKAGDVVKIHRTALSSAWVSGMDQYEGMTSEVHSFYSKTSSGNYWNLIIDSGIFGWNEEFLTLVPPSVPTQEEKMMVIDTDVSVSSEVKPTPEPAFDFDAYYGVKK